MSDSSNRVVITGLGVISPIGNDLDTFWKSLISKKSGISQLDSFPAGILPVRQGAEAKGFTGDIENFGPLDKVLQRNIRKGQKVMCREIEMGVASCQLALHHSGLDSDRRIPERTGIVFGCDYILTRPEEFIDGIRACGAGSAFCLSDWPTQGLPQVNPLWLLKYLPNMPASHVAIYNDLQGPSNSITSREASNSLCIAEAVSAIRRGVADAMLVGSTGSMIHPIRSLHLSMQVPIAADRVVPSEMSRPYQRDRDGLVLGEGAGAMVLESLDSAKKRGATIWGEVLACSSSTVGPDRHPDAIRKSVSNAIRILSRRVGAEMPRSWHIHAMGNGHPAGDAAEAQGIRDALGAEVEAHPVVAAKSYFGNLGAGSAAAEVVASCLALHHTTTFPTLNQDNPDPNCPMVIAANPTAAGDAFMHVSYTMQGQASAVAIKKFS